MKTHLQILSLVCAGMLLQGGCSTTDVRSLVTPENVGTATFIVCSNTLTFAVQDKDRVEVANYLYAVAHIVRTLSGGTVPTPTEMQSAISLVTPDAKKWATLGTSLGAIWGGAFVQIHGNPALALKYIEAIATNCERAAEVYVAPAAPSPTP